MSSICCQQDIPLQNVIDYIVFLECHFYLFKVQYATCYIMWWNYIPEFLQVGRYLIVLKIHFILLQMWLTNFMNLSNLSKVSPILDCLVVRLTVLFCILFFKRSCLVLVINVVKKFKGNMKVQNVICSILSNSKLFKQNCPLPQIKVNGRNKLNPFVFFLSFCWCIFNHLMKTKWKWRRVWPYQRLIPVLSL